MSSPHLPGYGPSHLPPSGESRFGTGPRILLVLIAMALVGGIYVTAGSSSFFPVGSFRGSPDRAGWTMYQSGRNGWSVEFPSSWYATRIGDVRRGTPYTIETQGLAMANIAHSFNRGSCGEDCVSTTVDNVGLPSDGVLVQITRRYGGHFACLQSHMTALPLSLARATRQTNRQGAGGSPQLAMAMGFSGPPIGTVIGNEAAGYSVEAWVGSQASAADLKILERIVASISYKISLTTNAPNRPDGTC